MSGATRTRRYPRIRRTTMLLALVLAVAFPTAGVANQAPDHHKQTSAGSVRWCKKHPSCIKRVNKRKPPVLAHIASIKPKLDRIAACESTNNPHAVGGGGKYRGLFQFDYTTWNEVGGHGDPAAASVQEQYNRAAILYHRAGPGRWPVCGFR